jgi:uncharacterized membrane protein YuzA (DUF378 family)
MKGGVKMEPTKQTEWTLTGGDWVALVIMIIGGLNWGLVGLFNFNVVTAIFGDMTVVSRVIYIIVGLAAIWSIIALSSHLHRRTFEAPQTPGAMAH